MVKTRQTRQCQPESDCTGDGDHLLTAQQGGETSSSHSHLSSPLAKPLEFSTFFSTPGTFAKQDHGLKSAQEPFITQKIQPVMKFIVSGMKADSSVAFLQEIQSQSLFFETADIPPSTTWVFLKIKNKGRCYKITPLCFPILTQLTSILALAPMTMEYPGSLAQEINDISLAVFQTSPKESSPTWLP